LTSQYIHRGWHHGLFRRESLQRIGGYYGGFRIAYDVFLMNLLLMTGRVAYVDQPLYNRWLRAESLENAAATGMRSPLRAEVHRRLGRSYTDVFKQYQAYLQGSLSWAEMIEAIRTISARYVTAQDQTALVEETERLRTLLEIRPPVMTPLALAAPPKTIATPAAVALESRLSQLLHSPQLPWKDGAISKTVAVELVHLYRSADHSSFSELAAVYPLCCWRSVRPSWAQGSRPWNTIRSLTSGRASFWRNLAYSATSTCVSHPSRNIPMVRANVTSGTIHR
jgi:hypothetical protein